MSEDCDHDDEYSPVFAPNVQEVQMVRQEGPRFERAAAPRDSAAALETRRISATVLQESYDENFNGGARAMSSLEEGEGNHESSQVDTVVKKAMVSSNDKVTARQGTDPHSIDALQAKITKRKRERLEEKLDYVDGGGEGEKDNVTLPQNLVHVTVPRENYKLLKQHQGKIKVADTPGLKDSKSALYGSDKVSDAELRSILKHIPKETNTSHRILLFEMFFQCNTTELESLASASGTSLGDIVSTRRKYHKRPRENDDSRKGCESLLVKENYTTVSEPLARKRIKGPETIALIPLALTIKNNALQQTNRGMVGTMNAPVQSANVGESGTPFRGRNHKSLPLRALESSVLSSFESSPVGISAIATMNPLYDRFLKRNEQMGAMPPPLLVQPSKNKFLAMSLKYNACSMATFAQWVQSSEGECNGGDAAFSRRGQYSWSTQIPASRVMFHRCQMCGDWGHYELECDQGVESNTLMKVADELGIQRRISKFATKEKPNHLVPSPLSRKSAHFCCICKYSVIVIPAPFLMCKGCQMMCHQDCVGSQHDSSTDGDWFCHLCCAAGKLDEGFDSVVDLEGCDGFVVEQRKPPEKLENSFVESSRSPSMGIGFGNPSWSKILCLTEGKRISRIVSRKVKEAAKLVVPEKSDLERTYAVGEFCWVKRVHTSKGKFARDEWWPAQVMMVATHMKNAEHFNNAVTPYTVRLFAVQNANRVRASHIVPFFKHFRAIGYQRVKVKKPNESARDRAFRRGLEEVMQMMGYHSITQILAHSDEESTRESTPPPEAPERRAIKVETPANFSTTFRQDGFTISVEELDRKAASSSELKIKKVLQKPTRNPVASFSRSKLVGCVVAWTSTEECETVMKVGIVQAANMNTMFALVSQIPDWRAKLTPSTLIHGVVVCSQRTTTVEWIAMNRLHLITNGPEEGSKQEIREEVISNVIEAARVKAIAEWKKKVLTQEGKAAIHHQQKGIDSLVSTTLVDAKDDEVLPESAHPSLIGVVATVGA